MNDHEIEFFLTGSKIYLDIRKTMENFDRLVQMECELAVREKLDRVIQACDMQWTSNSVKDYFYRHPLSFDIGKKILIKEAGLQGGLYFFLKLARSKANGTGDSLSYEADVQLYRGNKNALSGLWDSARSIASETKFGITKFEVFSDSLFFRSILMKTEVQDISRHLARTIDDFTSLMKSLGGLRKFLTPISRE